MKAQILRTSPAGLIVSLPDGREGLIRERELGWSAATRQGWNDRYRQGDVVQVVPLGKGRARRPELSVRLAQLNSWGNIEQRYPIGSLVAGVVGGIMRYGVFVELEAGVTGLMHRTRFPAWAHRPPSEMFWPGDLVKVAIEAIDPTRQRITLSMTDLPARRWRGAATAAEPSVSLKSTIQETNLSRPTLEMLFARPAMSVVIVEDSPDQRRSVADWLRYTGQEVESVASAEEAIEVVAGAHPDMVLMDVGLPGMNGIQGIREIKARWPELRCVLMTDWGRAERYEMEVQDLRKLGVALLIKPFLPEDLLDALLETSAHLAPPSVRMSSSRSAGERSHPTLARAEQSELLDILSQLQNATHADKVVVFELDLDARQVGILEQRGPLPLRSGALPGLIQSPVRDAAEDEQVVVARNTHDVTGERFRHLIPLLDFEAYLGLPVRVRVRRRYALFLFYLRPTNVNETTVARAEAAAAAVGVWLERRQFVRQSADLHRITVLGQLSRALVHEISGRLTPINLTLQRLQAGCDKVEEYAISSPAQVAEEAKHARQELQNLAQQAQALARTTRSFGRMTRPGHDEILILEEIVKEAVDVLSDAAATAHVSVLMQPAPRRFFTRAQVTYLQQALVNVLQNAIQQIHQARPQGSGQVEIRLSHAQRDGQQVLQIRVEDDGPGIHRRLWERIFEMDYTTRPDGSGLGLYVSRSLIESQGGRIFVTDSHVLWGAEFVIELPYRT